MPIRLRGVGNYKTPTNSNDIQKGYNITFTNGIIYDLDELTKLKSRVSSDAALAVQVIDEKAVIRKLIEDFDFQVSDNVTKDINSAEKTKTKIISIVQEATEKYGNIDTTTAYYKSVILPYIETEINKYMKTVVKEYDLDYSVSISGSSGTSISIKYNFSDSDELDSLLSSLYYQYNERKAYISDDMIDSEIEKEVGVGQLAISNSKRNKTIGYGDYKSGLLDRECKHKQSSSDTYIPGRRKPLIIWTEGTADNTYSHAEPTLQDEVDSLKKKLKELYNNPVIPPIPDNDGTWFLQAKTVNGETVYSWVKNPGCSCGGGISFEEKDGVFSATIMKAETEDLDDESLNLIVPENSFSLELVDADKSYYNMIMEEK